MSHYVSRFCVSRFCFGVLPLYLALLGTPVQADLLNGSFEGFMANWTAFGPNSAVPVLDGVLPTDGNLMAYLNNGTGAQSLLIQDFVITANFGMNPGDFSAEVTAVYPAATHGATLFQEFSLGPLHSAISFDWNFLTNEPTPSVSTNDFAFAALLNAANAVVFAAALDTASTFGPGGAQYVKHTGWSNVVISGLTPGADYKLLFGVFDSGNTSVNSALLVDNIQAIPEPSSAVLLLTSLIGVSRYRRRMVR